MKREKREITLNERDSLLDIALLERGLACAYLPFCTRAESKEEGELLKENLMEVIDDEKRVLKALCERYGKEKG